MAAPLPTAARFVVFYALIFGTWELISFAMTASQGFFNFTTQLLLLPVALGLMAASNWWRRAARVLFAINILIAPIVLIMLLIASSNGTLDADPHPVLFILAFAHWAFAIWAFRVLARADVIAACD